MQRQSRRRGGLPSLSWIFEGEAGKLTWGLPSSFSSCHLHQTAGRQLVKQLGRQLTNPSASVEEKLSPARMFCTNLLLQLTRCEIRAVLISWSWETQRRHLWHTHLLWVAFPPQACSSRCQIVIWDFLQFWIKYLPLWFVNFSNNKNTALPDKWHIGGKIEVFISNKHVLSSGKITRACCQARAFKTVSFLCLISSSRSSSSGSSRSSSSSGSSRSLLLKRFPLSVFA